MGRPVAGSRQWKQSRCVNRLLFLEVCTLLSAAALGLLIMLSLLAAAPLGVPMEWMTTQPGAEWLKPTSHNKSHRSHTGHAALTPPAAAGSASSDAVSAGAAARTNPGCSCTSDDVMPSSTCSLRGTPHFKTFGGVNYDFVARGVHRLVKTTTSCGCDLEVQTFMMSTPKHATATFNVGVAMKVGATTFTIKSNLQLIVNATSYNIYDVGKHGKMIGGSLVQMDSHVNEGKTSTGYKIGIPGGGELHAYSWKTPHDGFPHDSLLSVWVSLPHEAASTSSGLCSSTAASSCVKETPLPNHGCGDSVCLPVFTDDSIFPSKELRQLESYLGGGGPVATRVSKVECKASELELGSFCREGESCAKLPKCSNEPDKIALNGVPIDSDSARPLMTSRQGLEGMCFEKQGSGKFQVLKLTNCTSADSQLLYFESMPPPSRIKIKSDPSLCLAWKAWSLKLFNCESIPSDYGSMFVFDSDDPSSKPTLMQPGVPLSSGTARRIVAADQKDTFESSWCVDTNSDDSGFLYMGKCAPAATGHQSKSSSSASFYFHSQKTSCRHDCSDPELDNMWYANIEHTTTSAVMKRDQCAGWCRRQSVEDCEIRSALLLPNVKLHCAFNATEMHKDGTADGHCSTVLGRDVQRVSAPYGLFASEAECDISPYAVEACTPTIDSVKLCDNSPINNWVNDTEFLASLNTTAARREEAAAACSSVVAKEECMYDFCNAGHSHGAAALAAMNDALNSKVIEHLRPPEQQQQPSQQQQQLPPPPQQSQNWLRAAEAAAVVPVLVQQEQPPPPAQEQVASQEQMMHQQEWEQQQQARQKQAAQQLDQQLDSQVQSPAQQPEQEQLLEQLQLGQHLQPEPQNETQTPQNDTVTRSQPPPEGWDEASASSAYSKESSVQRQAPLVGAEPQLLFEEHATNATVPAAPAAPAATAAPAKDLITSSNEWKSRRLAVLREQIRTSQGDASPATTTTDATARLAEKELFAPAPQRVAAVSSANQRKHHAKKARHQSQK